MALGPAYHDTLANMQRSVKGTEFFVLGGSYGAFSRVRCLSGLWRTASPMAGCLGQAMGSPEKGWTSPQGARGMGHSKRDCYAVAP